MLTRRALSELSKSHEHDLVLSVYLARKNADPGDRGAWRLRLEAALAEIAKSLEERAPGELAAFESARGHLTSALDRVGRVLPAEGWAAFASEEGLIHACELAFAPREIARWRRGLYVTPYLRAFKDERPVGLALVDHWHARIYSYEEGRLTLRDELSADRTAVDASDVGVSKRPATSTGVRGATRTDYARRIVGENAKRLRRQIAERLSALIGDHGGVVLGGTERAVSALRSELERSMDGRIIEAPEISFDSTIDELTAAVAERASELTTMRQARLLEACAGERGARGWNDTYRGLTSAAVDTLLIARPWLEASPDDAEQLVRMALAQGAEVEELGNELGLRLAEDGGVASRLRFRPAI
ncbi:MAG TPA: hypothetical protein VFQ22_02225 [Longimicrobiales bacterium]|nr:hypothetical protein [Longimicrobiales bacterium]